VQPHVAPQLAFSTQEGRFRVTNSGSQTVKLPSLNLAGMGATGPIYLLPGATHDFGARSHEAPAIVRIRTQDMRSGANISTDLAP
jgi:hypothetical protein